MMNVWVFVTTAIAVGRLRVVGSSKGIGPPLVCQRAIYGRDLKRVYHWENQGVRGFPATRCRLAIGCRRRDRLKSAREGL